MSNLPADPKARKAIPIFSGVLKYFPDAMAEIAKVSYVGNEQHHPGTALHWDRSKSTDQEDALIRHLLEGGRDGDGCLASARVAWRALARCQLDCEAERRLGAKLAVVSSISERMPPPIEADE